GLYSSDVMAAQRALHDNEFYHLRHSDSVDVISAHALRSMVRKFPALFDDRFMHEAWSRGYNARIKYCRSPIMIEGLHNGFSRSSRPNGFDTPSWDNWEVDREMVEA